MLHDFTFFCLCLICYVGPTATSKKGDKRTRDEANAKTKHQGTFYAEGDDPHDALDLLPAGIQAQIVAMATEKERVHAISAYLNGLLSLLPTLKKMTVLAQKDKASRIKLLLQLTDGIDISEL